MRKNLKDARRKLGLSQEKMAESLDTSLKNYQFLEESRRNGSIAIWDKLEDMTGINQRVLRENF